MHKEICDIQNSIWKAYTDYSKTGDMGEYNRASKAITAKYKDNPLMYEFAVRVLISWMPVISYMAKESNEGK
ncbi:MAG: hypothetical protein R3Y58_03465 [Eubacteriales bacterium]